MVRNARDAEPLVYLSYTSELASLFFKFPYFSISSSTRSPALVTPNGVTLHFTVYVHIWHSIPTDPTVVLLRIRTPLSFSLLDSFPHIYSHTPASVSSESVSVLTALSTDTSVALRIKNLQRVVGRFVGVEERETLSNTLGEIAEAYEEGWDSGSDEDDD